MFCFNIRIACLHPPGSGVRGSGDHQVTTKTTLWIASPGVVPCDGPGRKTRWWGPASPSCFQLGSNSFYVLYKLDLNSRTHLKERKKNGIWNPLVLGFNKCPHLNWWTKWSYEKKEACTKNMYKITHLSNISVLILPTQNIPNEKLRDICAPSPPGVAEPRVVHWSCVQLAP